MVAGRVKAARSVGRYQLVHELGQSYLGPLWAVRTEGGDGSKQLGMLRLVSLARLDADTRVRLLEAAWQAMEVRDDRICSVTDVVASDGELGIVSDYVEGVTLRGLSSFASVRRKPAPAAVALRIALDLLAAVVALHRTTAELGEEAVPLFGGLSADSVLLSSDGRTLVLDVAVTSAASSVETLGGNPERAAYAAPEQLGSPARADARTDVFTTGVLLWELLACRRLFVGTDKTVAQKVLSSKIPRPDELRRKGDPEIPSALAAVVMKALDRNPDLRPQTAEAFQAELEASGIVPADHAEVAVYVTTLAEGALQRARDALRSTRTAMLGKASKPAEPPAAEARAPLPPRNPVPPAPADVKPAPAEAKPAFPAPADVKPAFPAPADTRPALPARAEAKPPLPARADVKAMMMMPARTEAKPAVPVRTDTKLKIRPRQSTMIGIPAPAGPQPAPVPVAPAPAPAPAETVSDAPEPVPPPDLSDEEPTAQFTSRELLRQVQEMDRKSEPAKGPPTEPPSGTGSEDFPEPQTFPKPAELPHLDAPVDGGWLDDPASPPPPSSRVDREAPTPDDPLEVAIAPPKPRPEPAPVHALAPQPPWEPPTPRAPDRPLVSKAPAPLSIPPASMAQSAAYLPSQVPPPLIHDPRARGSSARRAVPASVEAATGSSRDLNIGIALSIALVIVSAAVAILYLRHQHEEESESVPATPMAGSATSPAPASAPESPSAAAVGSAPDGGPRPNHDVANGERPMVRTPVPPRASPRPQKRAPPKKKGRYVPGDI